MKKTSFLILVFAISILPFGCSRDKEAINLVRSSKMLSNVFAQKTVEDFTKEIAEDEARKGITCEWKAQERDKKVYLVAFVKTNTDWGHYWEADLSNKIVRYANNNKLLSEKYGLSRLRDDGSFTIEEIRIDTLGFKYEKHWYSGKSENKGIIYRLEALVRNNTDKTITEAKLKGNLFVIFNVDKILESSTYGPGFTDKVTTSNPWPPKTVRLFHIETEPIDKIYADYKPSSVFCEIDFKASDPIGYEFDGCIKKIDLKWELEKKD